MFFAIHFLPRCKKIWGTSCWNARFGLIMEWLLTLFLKAILFLHRHHYLYLRGCLKESYYCSMLLTSNALLPSIVMESKLIYCKGLWANRKHSLCSWEQQFIVLSSGASLSSSGQGSHMPFSHAFIVFDLKTPKPYLVQGHESSSLIMKLKNMIQFFHSLFFKLNRKYQFHQIADATFCRRSNADSIGPARLGPICLQFHNLTVKKMPFCPFMLAPTLILPGEANNSPLILEVYLLHPLATLPSELIRQR